jgi:hypothetical protein
MDAFELSEELDKCFGNPLGPKRYAIVKEAVTMLRLQAEEIKAMQSHISELVTQKLVK